MAKHNNIAPGYAASLYALARAEGAVDTLEDQMFALSKGIAASRDLRDYLSDAAVPAEQQKKALGEILQPDVSPIVRGYVDILIDTGKAALIVDVADAFVALVQDEKKQVLAEVTSAVPLTPELVEQLVAELGKTSGRKVNVKNSIDESIVGGLVVKMEGKIIDLSIRRKLDTLRDSLRTTL